jgi:SAM-dependent methyltransferase
LTAAESWASALAEWAIPTEILVAAPESPYVHDPALFAVDSTMDRDGTSARRALQALADSGSVLDVGVGGGRASLVLVPPASRVTGVDGDSVMLESFASAAAERGVPARPVLGRWPDVAADVGVHDVVVCHNVLYNVPDIADFVPALTAHARRLVVVEIPVRHSQTRMAGAWLHFHGIRRPSRPTAEDAVAVLRELGLDVTVEPGFRPAMAAGASEPSRRLAYTRRRLCLPADRDPEIAAYLREHPTETPTQVVTLSWAAAGG